MGQPINQAHFNRFWSRTALRRFVNYLRHWWATSSIWVKCFVVIFILVYGSLPLIALLGPDNEPNEYPYHQPTEEELAEEEEEEREFRFVSCLLAFVLVSMIGAGGAWAGSDLLRYADLVLPLPVGDRFQTRFRMSLLLALVALGSVLAGLIVALVEYYKHQRSPWPGLQVIHVGLGVGLLFLTLGLGAEWYRRCYIARHTAFWRRFKHQFFLAVLMLLLGALYFLVSWFYLLGSSGKVPYALAWTAMTIPPLCLGRFLWHRPWHLHENERTPFGTTDIGYYPRERPRRTEGFWYRLARRWTYHWRLGEGDGVEAWFAINRLLYWRKSMAFLFFACFFFILVPMLLIFGALFDELQGSIIVSLVVTTILALLLNTPIPSMSHRQMFHLRVLPLDGKRFANGSLRRHLTPVMTLWLVTAVAITLAAYPTDIDWIELTLLNWLCFPLALIFIVVALLYLVLNHGADVIGAIIIVNLLWLSYTFFSSFVFQMWQVLAVPVIFNALALGCLVRNLPRLWERWEPIL